MYEVKNLCKDFVNLIKTFKEYNGDVLKSALEQAYLIPNQEMLKLIYKKYNVKEFSINDSLNQLDLKVNFLFLEKNFEKFNEAIKETIEKCFSVYSLIKPLEILIFFSFGLKNNIKFDNNSCFRIYVPLKLYLILVPSERIEDIEITTKEEIRKMYLDLIESYVYLCRIQSGFTIENLLDKICLKGIFMFFLEEIEKKGSLFSHLNLSSVELEWCKSNIWFLWELLSNDLYNQFSPLNIKNYGKLKRISSWIPKEAENFLGCEIINSFIKRRNIKSIDILLNLKFDEVLKTTYLGKYRMI